MPGLIGDRESLINGATDLEALEAAGVSVTFLDLGVNTATDAGKLALRMLMAVADFERSRIANRMSIGRLGRLRAGKWPGGPHPYGFTTDHDGYLARDGDQAHTLLRIFHLVAQGQGSNAVANLLNSEGVPGPTGNAWNYPAITELVKRGAEYSTGKLTRTQGPKGQEETHGLSAPVMVDPDTAKQARKALARNAEARPQKRRVARSYALSDLRTETLR